MSLGFSVLRDETLKLLNETDASVVGELASGIGGAATIASDDTILDYLNEAAKEMTRSCCYLQATETLGAAISRVHSFAATNIWHPQVVTIGGSPLIHCGEQELSAFNNTYLTTTGTPTHWYKNGPYQIGLYPTPTASVTPSIIGAVTVASITAGSEVFDFAPDDILLKALPSYAASKLAMKNYDDPSLVGRAFWKDWYDIARMTLWAQLDTSYKAPGALFSIPPVNAGGGK